MYSICVCACLAHISKDIVPLNGIILPYSRLKDFYECFHSEKRTFGLPATKVKMAKIWVQFFIYLYFSTEAREGKDQKGRGKKKGEVAEGEGIVIRLELMNLSFGPFSVMLSYSRRRT